jgi:O-antigen/teichoic acid export membrane protein
VLGVFLQLAVQVLVGRLTGSAGVGLMQLYITWTCVLGEGVAMGRPAHAMKTMAVARDQSLPAVIKYYLKQQLLAIVLVWLAFIALASGLIYNAGDLQWVLSLAAVSALFFALLRLLAEALKAQGRANLSVFAESVGPPLAVVCLGCYCLVLGKAVESLPLVLALAGGFLACLLLLLASQARLLAALPGRNSTPLRFPMAELAPLWGAGLLSMLFLNFPFLLLPLYTDTGTVGEFALAHKLVNLISTILLLLAAIFGPRFARSINSADVEGIRRSLWQSQLCALALYLPSMALLALFGKPLLSLFGESLAGAELFLWILAAGQLVNAATGLPGLLLLMGGAGQREFTALAVTLLIATTLTLWVGPRWGAPGIAIVYSAAIAGKNLISYVIACQFINQQRPLEGEELLV